MIDASFYKNIAALGEPVVREYRQLENALVFIKGQVARFEIDRARFFMKEKSRFEPDLDQVRNHRCKPPSPEESSMFSMHVRVINKSLAGHGVRHRMVVSNSLAKLFFDSV